MGFALGAMGLLVALMLPLRLIPTQPFDRRVNEVRMVWLRYAAIGIGVLVMALGGPLAEAVGVPVVMWNRVWGTLTLVAVVVANGLRHRALRAAVQAEEQRLPGNVF